MAIAIFISIPLNQCSQMMNAFSLIVSSEIEFNDDCLNSSFNPHESISLSRHLTNQKQR